MKLLASQPAPEFQIRDVFGESINLRNLRGKKVYLAFERNAGCPVCNLRINQLLKHSDLLRGDAVVLLVYESSNEKMLEYLEREAYPFHFIADPGNELYKLYAVEKSWLKLMSSLLNGIISKVNAGKKLFNKSIVQDGHANTIPAEFIISEEGKISLVHYGKFVGDHLTIPYLLRALAQRVPV
jgi:thioredoxin-dependent peroxiredoxin